MKYRYPRDKTDQQSGYDKHYGISNFYFVGQDDEQDDGDY